MAIALATLAATYLALVAVLYVAQSALIYPAPDGIGPSTGGFEEVGYATSDGLELTAGYRAARSGFPTIVYFHGVLAAEYRGYRGNPGRPSEEGFYRDRRAALAFLAANGVPFDRIVIIGNSIGAGVAVQMASEAPPAALVLISPFASLSGLVAEKFRWLPTGLLLRDRYENAAKLGAIEAPVLVLHGDADTLIPYSHSEKLASLRADIELHIFEGYGHDLAWHDIAEKAVLDFMARHLGKDENP